MDAQATDPRRGILDKLRGGARFCDRKIGLHRIGVALSLTIIAVAVVVLYHILHDLNVDELLRALERQPTGARLSSPDCSSPPVI